MLRVLARREEARTAVSYAYDAFGRRKSKTLNSTTTSFLYDGANVVQEQSASTTNLLTGLGIDETFARTIGTAAGTALIGATCFATTGLEPFHCLAAIGAGSAVTGALVCIGIHYIRHGHGGLCVARPPE